MEGFTVETVQLADCWHIVATRWYRSGATSGSVDTTRFGDWQAAEKALANRVRQGQYRLI